MNLVVLEKRIRNPFEFEEEFLAFWKEIGAQVTQEKSVAQVSLYDSRALGAGITRFFTGALVAFNTNLSAFIRPETEHLLITRIKYLEGVAAVVNESVWEPGTGLIEDATKNGQISISNNGVQVLRRYPLNSSNGNITTKDDGVIELEEPIPWIGQTELIIDIDLPNAPGVNTNGQIQLAGIGYIG